MVRVHVHAHVRVCACFWMTIRIYGLQSFTICMYSIHKMCGTSKQCPVNRKFRIRAGSSQVNPRFTLSAPTNRLLCSEICLSQFQRLNKS